MRLSDPEFRRFLVAGLFNTLAGYLLYLVLCVLVDYRLAYTLSYAAGIVLAYAVNTLFVFRVAWNWHSLIAFPSVYVLQYALGLGLVWFLVQMMGVPAKFAPLLVIPILVPVTFLASRLVVKGKTHGRHGH